MTKQTLDVQAMIEAAVAKALSGKQPLITDKSSWGNARPFSAKVSDKGCLTVQCDGLRRFGATYYANEWEAILNHADEIRAAIKANAKSLKRK